MIDIVIPILAMIGGGGLVLLVAAAPGSRSVVRPGKERKR